jgi:hypothetical protein
LAGDLREGKDSRHPRAALADLAAREVIGLHARAERLYGNSHLLNADGQWAYYGRVGGCIITGNEDGAKHCAMNILYSLQHVGFTIPPQADSGWLGEAGPGPSYCDFGSGGPENDFTNRNTTFLTWNLMHMERILKDAGGVPAHGNQVALWDAACRFDYENPGCDRWPAGHNPAEQRKRVSLVQAVAALLVATCATGRVARCQPPRAIGARALLFRRRRSRC